MKRYGMHLLRFVLLAALSAPPQACGQRTKAEEELLRTSELFKPESIIDRAGGTHNRSNIGLFFENRGKLYPRRAAQGPSGDWPIGSFHEYVYRINPFVGVPGNVIQGRYTTNEEWEAAAGYHNRDSAQIAFSDKPSTWPASGWPVKAPDGSPIFVSDQDSYCVYNDSNNTVATLGLEIHQTGYAFALKLVQDMIFYSFAIVNRSQNTYDSLYFALYVDCDVGNVSGGDPEYDDDRIGFDRDLQLLYFHDDGFSSEWSGNVTGHFGAAMLRTPEVNGVQVGVTDMHYNLYDDEIDRDTLQYGILSSAPSLYASPIGARYFHPGSNLPDIHFDDPATIPASGIDLLGYLSSGPYTIPPGDTLTFVTVLVAGMDLEDIRTNTQRAYDLMNSGFSSPRPPDPPQVRAIATDRRVTITWDNRSELSRDRLSGAFDFEGYRLYRSVDRGQRWDQFDRNQFPSLGADPVPLASFDMVNGVGDDTGLQYSYVDSTVVNGFEYWYSVTAYDAGDSLVPSLESARGNNAEAINLDIAFPRSPAAGRDPVSAGTVSHTGPSTVTFSAVPADAPAAGGGSYEITFAPVARVAAGNLRSLIETGLDSVGARTSDVYAFVFTDPATVSVRNLTRGTVDVPAAPFTSGVPIPVNGLRVTITDTSSFPDQRPEGGDSIVVSPGIGVTSGGQIVLPRQEFLLHTSYATSTLVVVTGADPDPVREIRQTAGTNPLTVSAAVSTPANLTDDTFTLSVVGVNQGSGGGAATLDLELRNSTQVLVVARDSVSSGGTLEGAGLTLTVSFSASLLPGAGTAVQITTVRPKPVTYNDRYTFSTAAASVDPQRVAAELGNVKVVPNPYLVSSLYEEEFGALRREPIRALKFINLPPRCTITIFTMDGDRVQTIEHASDGGTATWDLRAAGGREIAPGVYFFHVQADNAEHLGRFAVIK